MAVLTKAIPKMMSHMMARMMFEMRLWAFQILRVLVSRLRLCRIATFKTFLGNP